MSIVTIQNPPSLPGRPEPQQPAFTSDPIWRMPVETYHTMIASNELTENDRVELVEGVLIYRMAVDEIHVAVSAALRDLLGPLLDSRTSSYREQAPVTLLDGEPQPDGAIANGPRHHFARLGRKPLGHEVSWVAEVANTSLRIDRGAKLRSYARAAIVTYWIVNLDARTVEVHTDPEAAVAEPTYRTMIPYGSGQRVPVVVNGVTLGDIAVDDLLP